VFPWLRERRQLFVDVIAEAIPRDGSSLRYKGKRKNMPPQCHNCLHFVCGYGSFVASALWDAVLWESSDALTTLPFSVPDATSMED
jgi:hypothetical protein